MKKILIILLAILCIPISSFAISLSTLENNPQRYEDLGGSTGIELYLDYNSVQSLVYNPPYYRMKVKVYGVVYNQLICAYSCVLDYDYYYSTKSTASRIIADMNENNEPLDEDVCRERLDQSIRENTGIELTMEPLAVWTTRGKLISNNRKSLRTTGNEFSTIIGFGNVLDQTRSVELGTAAYYIAQYTFKSYYNQFF